MRDNSLPVSVGRRLPTFTSLSPVVVSLFCRILFYLTMDGRKLCLENTGAKKLTQLFNCCLIHTELTIIEQLILEKCLNSHCTAVLI